MGEVTEKIYCCDRGDNDNALAAAILANGRRDNDGWPMAAAMMNNGGWNQNQWMNNPFAYLMFLALFRNGGFGFGWNNNCGCGNGCGWNNNCGCGNGCGCQATTQVIVEEFMAAFQEQTGLPTNVVLSAEGQTQRLANVSCGSSNCLAIYSSLTVTITPAAAPAA